MTDSVVFVVRIWPGSGFRAAVRQVDEEQTHLFDAPAALARFLLERSCSPGTKTADPDSWRTP